MSLFIRKIKELLICHIIGHDWGHGGPLFAQMWPHSRMCNRCGRIEW